MLILFLFPFTSAAAPAARSSPIVDPFRTVDPFAFSDNSVATTTTKTPSDPFETFSSNSNVHLVRYRVLYDYVPTHPDELAIAAGEIVQIDPTAQQSADWLEGQTSNGKKGFFPANYVEEVSSAETKTNHRNQVDTTSTLTVSKTIEFDLFSFSLRFSFSRTRGSSLLPIVKAKHRINI